MFGQQTPAPATLAFYHRFTSCWHARIKRTVQWRGTMHIRCRLDGRDDILRFVTRNSVDVGWFAVFLLQRSARPSNNLLHTSHRCVFLFCHCCRARGRREDGLVVILDTLFSILLPAHLPNNHGVPRGWLASRCARAGASPSDYPSVCPARALSYTSRLF